jgi:putative radical SAM enzyme (TIGR03279 family)
MELFEHKTVISIRITNRSDIVIEILEIETGSIAEDLGIEKGAKLISINSREINDELDYRFHNNGEELEVLIEAGGGQTIYEIEKEPHDDIGLIVDEMKMRKCGNSCIFCFVHQSPKGLRKPLYFKDEDYRFSFLHGHYVTLTNTSQKDLERIVEQQLSPLYVSVHVTDSDLRKHMLGLRKEDNLLEKLTYLTNNGIELQTQIVLCPGLNDGTVLDDTIADLKAFYPNVGSIAIVPVGLTKHRTWLPTLEPVTPEYSLETMKVVDEKRRQLKDELGKSFIYLSDEFYISTDTTLPATDYYDDFFQLENGVGLTRDFINRFQEELPEIQITEPDLNLTLVSGTLGTTALRKYFLPELEKLPNLNLTLHEVKNQFYGETITVAGLLVGEDIYNVLKDQPLGDYVVLPPRVLNHDRIFLDDWTIEQLEEKLGKEVLLYPDSFITLFENIEMLKGDLSEDEAKEIRHTIPVAYMTEKSKGGEEFVG